MIDFCLCGRLREGCTYHDPKLQPGYVDWSTYEVTMHDVSGTSYIQGITNFTYENVFDALSKCNLQHCMGNGGDCPTTELRIVMHHALQSRLNRCNLLDLWMVRDTFCGLWLETRDAKFEKGVTVVSFELDGKTLGLLKIREH